MSAITVVILWSGIWQMSSTIVASGGECVVVDPGYFPRELDEVARAPRASSEMRAVAGLPSLAMPPDVGAPAHET